MGNKILLTGTPACGKTTIVQKLSTMLPGVAGFYTVEIREEEGRKGFRLVDLSTGEEHVLSHVDFKSPYRVGRYGVDIEVFEAFLDRLVLDEPVVLIDEIGKMECLSQKFRTFIEELLRSDKQIVATIALKGTPFIESLKRIPGIRIVHVTPADRETLPEEIIKDLDG